MIGQNIQDNLIGQRIGDINKIFLRYSSKRHN